MRDERWEMRETSDVDVDVEVSRKERMEKKYKGTTFVEKKHRGFKKWWLSDDTRNLIRLFWDIAFIGFFSFFFNVSFFFFLFSFLFFLSISTIDCYVSSYVYIFEFLYLLFSICVSVGVSSMPPYFNTTPHHSSHLIACCFWFYLRNNIVMSLTNVIGAEVGS